MFPGSLFRFSVIAKIVDGDDDPGLRRSRLQNREFALAPSYRAEEVVAYLQDSHDLHIGQDSC